MDVQIFLFVGNVLSLMLVIYVPHAIYLYIKVHFTFSGVFRTKLLLINLQPHFAVTKQTEIWICC